MSTNLWNKWNIPPNKKNKKRYFYKQNYDHLVKFQSWWQTLSSVADECHWWWGSLLVLVRTRQESWCLAVAGSPSCRLGVSDLYTYIIITLCGVFHSYVRSACLFFSPNYALTNFWFNLTRPVTYPSSLFTLWPVSQNFNGTRQLETLAERPLHAAPNICAEPLWLVSHSDPFGS